MTLQVRERDNFDFLKNKEISKFIYFCFSFNKTRQMPHFMLFIKLLSGLNCTYRRRNKEKVNFDHRSHLIPHSINYFFSNY